MQSGAFATITERAGSTMDLARCYDGAQGFPYWIMALLQTDARGRQGKSWLSAHGSFSATLILQPNCTPAKAAQRSFVAAITLFRTLAEFVDPSKLSQKWPNDVLLNGGKVAGILLESSATGVNVDRLSVGIGVNLGFAPKGVLGARFRPVGLSDFVRTPPTPEEFLEALAAHFAVVEEKLVTKGFSDIRAEWNGQAARLGKNITVRTNQAEIRGIFDGIDEDGSLLLLTPSGKIVIPAADIYF